MVDPCFDSKVFDQLCIEKKKNCLPLCLRGPRVHRSSLSRLFMQFIVGSSGLYPLYLISCRIGPQVFHPELIDSPSPAQILQRPPSLAGGQTCVNQQLLNKLQRWYVVAYLLFYGGGPPTQTHAHTRTHMRRVSRKSKFTDSI